MTRRGALAVVLAAACACGGAGEPDDMGDPQAGAPDAAPPGQVDAAPGQVDAAPGQTGATLTGKVTRSTTPQAGGVGNLFVAIFTDDPVLAQGQALPVGQALIENADMTSDAAEIAYEVEVPTRAEPYFIVAFLDDNGTADVNDPDNAGPDRGDLISLDGIGSPQVTVDHSGVVEHDIVLNSVMPF